MTDYVQRQIEKRHSPLAVAAKFDRLRARKPETIFAAFEGMLDKVIYWQLVCKRFSSRSIKELICDGRDGVLGLLNHVRRTCGNTPNVIFFVDRDFDGFVGNALPVDDQLYVTDGYSVESQLVDVSAFRCLIDNVFCVEDGTISSDWIVAKYDGAYTAFAQALLPIMAWIISVRRLGGRTNLGNVQLARIVEIQGLDGVKRRSNALADFISQTQPDLSLVYICQIREALSELRKVSPGRAIRGKYALWFLVQFARLVRMLLRDAKAAGERAVFFDVDVTEQSLPSLLAMRLEPPNSLSTFLDKIAQKHT